MSEFVHWLRERILVQWALAYAARTCALLQVTDLVGDCCDHRALSR